MNEKKEILRIVLDGISEQSIKTLEQIERARSTEGDDVDRLRGDVSSGKLSFIEQRDNHVLESIDTFYPDAEPGNPDDEIIAFVEALKRTQFSGGYGRDISWGMFGFLCSFERNMPGYNNSHLRDELVKATGLGLLTFCICENGIGRDFIEIHFKK